MKIDKQGQQKVFTTDGNYCIDTPYNAQERMMAAFCFAGGFLGYEYWGVDWYMQNPFKWGMHKDRISAPAPESSGATAFRTATATSSTRAKHRPQRDFLFG